MANDILIRWLSDSSQAIRDMSKMDRALSNTTSRSQKYARRWNTAATVMRRGGIALGTALVGVSVEVVKAAAKQEQSLGGLQAVFKKQTPVMQEWARGLSEVGISMTDGANFAVKFGSALKGAGFSTEEAAQKTRDLIELGADLAATFDGPGGVSGAVDALSAALRGEFDPLEQWGVAIKQSDVNARLAAKGQDKLTGSARKQAEKVALLELIWKNTRDAQGQAAREADTASAAYRRFIAKLENVKADLGKVLLPFMSDLASRIADITAAAEKNPEAVAKWAKGLAALAASMILLSYSAKAVTVVNGLASAIRKFPGVAVAGAITAIAAALRKFAGPQKIADFWNNRIFTIDFWKGLGGAFGDFIDLIGSKVLEIPGVKQLALALAKISDLLGFTSGEYERTKAIFEKPIEIKVANDKALNAANTVQALLNDIVASNPKVFIRAANEQAKQAAKEAQRAVDGVKQRKKAQIDADAALARAKVTAWEAWATARNAVKVTVDANTAPARQSLSALLATIGGASGSVNVGIRTTRTSAPRSSAPATRSGIATAPASAAGGVVININGFGGNEDALARKITRTLDSAAVRYNRRGLAR